MSAIWSLRALIFSFNPSASLRAAAIFSCKSPPAGADILTSDDRAGDRSPWVLVLVLVLFVLGDRRAEVC